MRPGERRQRSGDSHDLVWIDHQIQNLVPWADVAPRMARQRPRRLIIHLIIHTIRQDPSGSVWTDDPSNVSRPDPSGADQIDAEHQATDLVLGEWTIAGLAVARGKVAEYLADGVVAELLADARCTTISGLGMSDPICYE